MQFDAALAAQDTLRESEAELGADWDQAIELEQTFSSNAGSTAREAYEQLLALAGRHPDAHRFQAFCISTSPGNRSQRRRSPVTFTPA
jgi:hypothetical protein